MREFLLATGLALQRDKCLGVFLEVVVQEFYRHMRLFVPGLGLEQVQRLVNLAHAADAKDLQEFEALLDDRTDIIIAGQVADGQRRRVPAGPGRPGCGRDGRGRVFRAGHAGIGKGRRDIGYGGARLLTLARRGRVVHDSADWRGRHHRIMCKYGRLQAFVALDLGSFGMEATELVYLPLQLGIVLIVDGVERMRFV